MVNGLLVMDVDGTLIREEVIDLLGEMAGHQDSVSQITAKAMAGELDFEQALKMRLALLKGLPVLALDLVYENIHLTKGAEKLIQTLQEKGYKIGLVSGGFHEIVDRLASLLKIDYVCANQLEVTDGVLTGKALGPIVTKETKLEKLREWAKINQLDLSQTVAIGDGANDVPMLLAAGIGIAFCAKDLVKAQTSYHIEVPNLSMVLSMIEQERI